MRKFLTIIFISLCLFSCDIRDYNYKVNCVYDVVYNDTTIRYDTIFSGGPSQGVLLLPFYDFFGINKNDYDNLKWDDEPVEVFLNMEK